MKIKDLIRSRAHAAPSTVMWLTGDHIPIRWHLLLRVATGEALPPYMGSVSDGDPAARFWLPLRKSVTQVDFSYCGA